MDAYRDVGSRYMEDFDLMLREDQVENAVAALAQFEWHPLNRDDFSNATRRWRHSNELVHESGLQCDLHWRLLRRPYRPVSENPVWNAKREIVLRETPTFAPAIEHTLVHLMAHGMSWQRVPPIRWILDTHLLLKRHRPDWSLVLADARRRGVIPAVREALTVYTSLLPGEIPSDIIRRANQATVSPDQFLAYEQIAGPYHEAPLRVRWAIYKSSLAEAQTRERIPRGLRGAAAHFCRHWLTKVTTRFAGR
jgi:hypothetical protein